MLRAAYLERRHEIRDRLQEFRAVPREEYFFELVYCLLTPQSSARNANVVTGILRVRDFALRPFDPETILRNGSHYIRFHKTKSVRLLQMTTMFGEVDRQLHIGLSAEQLRQWLVDHVNGLGMKEATPEEKAKAGRMALLASRTNTMLSIPMLFFMASSGHASGLF